MSEPIQWEYLSPGAQIVFQTPDDASYFFGYYDKCPLDRAGARLLAHRVGFDGRVVAEADSAGCGYFDLRSGAFTQFGSTQAFNWQQGAMLQWLPGADDLAIYNRREKDHFASRICNVKDGSARDISFPVYAVHPSGSFALGANYERLAFCRPGYNYQGVRNEKWNVQVHPQDGIFHVDLVSGSHRLLISTSDIVAIDPAPQMPLSDNWLEHIMWNRSGTRFAFLHRYSDPVRWARHRLFTASADGTGLYQFKGYDKFSHMGWRNDVEFTMFAMPNENAVRRSYVGVLRKHPKLASVLAWGYRKWKAKMATPVQLQKISAGGEAYFRMFDNGGQSIRLDKDKLTVDGHCTWTRDGRLMLTDTYSDNENYRHLLLYRPDRNEVYEVGRFYSGQNINDVRCDLHPRWDHSERKIIIDSASKSGGRRMMVIDVGEIIDSKGL